MDSASPHRPQKPCRAGGHGGVAAGYRISLTGPALAVVTARGRDDRLSRAHLRLKVPA